MTDLAGYVIAPVKQQQQVQEQCEAFKSKAQRKQAESEANKSQL